jgi:hypothetical protein
MTEVDYKASAGHSNDALVADSSSNSFSFNSTGERIKANTAAFVQGTKENAAALYQEVKYELTPPDSLRQLTFDDFKKFAANFYYVPYLPAFWNPGWLKNYAIGIVTPSLWAITFEGIWCDIWAGITVSLCLIPQGVTIHNYYSIRINLYPLVPCP